MLTTAVAPYWAYCPWWDRFMPSYCHRAVLVAVVYGIVLALLSARGVGLETCQPRLWSSSRRRWESLLAWVSNRSRKSMMVSSCSSSLWCGRHLGFQGDAVPSARHTHSQRLSVGLPIWLSVQEDV